MIRGFKARVVTKATSPLQLFLKSVLVSIWKIGRAGFLGCYDVPFKSVDLPLPMCVNLGYRNVLLTSACSTSQKRWGKIYVYL